MKTKKTIIILSIIMLAFSYAGTAQGLKYVKIKTSAQTELCKEKIEKTLAIEKGVKEVNLDLKTKVVTVKYDESKTTYEKLLTSISNIGYDADGKKADQKAHAKLPSECKESSGLNCSHKCSGHK
jgi:copper chaperone CopZ